VKILFIGDIVGRSGRTALKALLPNIRERFRVDFVIANGENSAAGFGITRSVATDLFSSGVDIITTGNHVWDKKEAVEYLREDQRVLRPLNYPPGVPGTGITISEVRSARVAVLNVSGRVFMASYDCPFRRTSEEVEALKGKADVIIIDFHAEATSEKIAFGRYFDGRVGAVIGTHTHVQTADEVVLPGGTAYITDVGMTGPVDSIIGVEIDQIIGRFLTLMPTRFKVAEGQAIFAAVIVEVDEKTGRSSSIQRLQLKHL
jgi:metallophosphoesterase (TIGR00282 family)